MQQFPEGFDAVRMGRIGLWLLGMRSHRASLARVAFPSVPYATLAWRFANLLAPWRIREYPGTAGYLSALLGISRSYARNVLKPGAKLSPKHARKMADFLEKRASACDALAAELRAYAGKLERSPKS